jgi:hypothetical protein
LEALPVLPGLRVFLDRREHKGRWVLQALAGRLPIRVRPGRREPREAGVGAVAVVTRARARRRLLRHRDISGTI